jgi:membrane protease YdiL (CAAX protease family)
MLKNDSSITWRFRPWAFAVVTLSILVILNYLHETLSRFDAYRSLYKSHPFYVPEGIDKIGGIVLCALAVWVLRRVAWKDIAHELGLAGSPLPALFFALVASSPMLIGFVLTRSLTPHMESLTIFFLTVLSPVAEEIEFRGFGVCILQRGTGWPFWVLVWPQALLFGMATSFGASALTIHRRDTGERQWLTTGASSLVSWGSSQEARLHMRSWPSRFF